MIKLKTFAGLVLGFSLLFSGCSGNSKVEYDKNKDYKPDEVKKIVFHDNQADDLLQLANKKLSPEESKKFRRSILVVHQLYGAKADGKTIGELFDLKLTREEVLKIKFNPDNIQAAYDAVSLSELSDSEKKAFETCVRGYNPNNWRGKTIGEMLDQREKDKKVEESEKKAPPTLTAPSVQSSNIGIKNVSAPDLVSKCIPFINPPGNSYGNQMIAITGKVLAKGTSNDGTPLFEIYEEKQKYSIPVTKEYKIMNLSGSDSVFVIVDSVQTLNRLPVGAFVKVTGRCVNAVITDSYKTRLYRIDDDRFYKKDTEVTVGNRVVYLQAADLEY